MIIHSKIKETKLMDLSQANMNTNFHRAKRLLFVVDKTSSMRDYFTALQSSLKQIFSVAGLTQEVEIGIILYGDYDSINKPNEQVIDWIPWQRITNDDEQCRQLLERISRTNLTWGADQPEACKTALNKVLEIVTDSSVPIIHYTDAPPHHDRNQDATIEWNNLPAEKKSLTEAGLTWDWVDICNQCKERNLNVFTILNSSSVDTQRFFALLGPTICVARNATPNELTRVTLGIILQLMGLGFDCDDRPIRVVKFSDESRLSLIQSENDSSGYLPGIYATYSRTTPITITSDAILVVPTQQYAHLDVKLKDVMNKFRTDETFVDKVCDTFATLFVPEHVLCLTYNQLFGKLWREVCKRRDDPRRQVLMDKLGSCGPLMKSADDARVLSNWIENSYDNSEAIKEYLSTQALYPRLILNIPSSEYMDRKKIQNVARTTCASEDLQRVMQFVSNIELVRGCNSSDTEEKKGIGNDGDGDGGGGGETIYLPYDIPPARLFALLPHLMCPGTEFSVRPAAIVAILTYLSGNVLLKAQAEQYLKDLINKWIRIDSADLEKWPENVTFQFAQLVLKVPWALTQDEIVFFQRLVTISKIRFNLDKMLSLTVGYDPKMYNATSDIKRPCTVCNENRSFTMLTPNDVCGLCLFGVQTNETCGDNNKSWMDRCKTCCCIYAIVDTYNLEVPPCCHYCRMKNGKQIPSGEDRSKFLCGFTNDQTPTVSCVKCLNKFVCPLVNQEDEQKSFVKHQFVCGACLANNSQAKTIQRDMKFRDLLLANPWILEHEFCISEKSLQSLLSPMSLLKLHVQDKIHWLNESGREERNRMFPPPPLMCGNQKVIDPVAALRMIHNEVLSGSTTADCVMCYNVLPLNSLHSACGKCNNTMCGNCLSTWYGQAKPGKIILPPHLLCPMCKQIPKWNVVKRYNKTLALMKHVKGSNPWDPRWYNGWCSKCYENKHCIERVCAQGVPELLQPFVCEQCKEKEQLQNEDEVTNNNASLDVLDRLKSCPGCHAKTVKSSGCNHISCVCGVHWCYECGSAFSSDSIYDHMRATHGSIWGGDDDDDQDDDY